MSHKPLTVNPDHSSTQECCGGTRKFEKRRCCPVLFLQCSDFVIDGTGCIAVYSWKSGLFFLERPR
ncbi:UNVERIFIED_CONTAM: hypothetical protein FKN15_074845 [Acipenser sinensis]